MRYLGPLFASSLLGLAPFADPAVAQAPPSPQDVVQAGPVSLAPAADGRPDIARFLLVRQPNAPVVTADGRWIAYLSDVTGAPQIWAIPAAGGFPQQLTYGSGIDWVQAVPGGSDLLYGADTDGDERVGMHLLSIDGLNERTVVEKSPAFRLFGTWADDGHRFAYASTERNGVDFDIYVADVASGRTERVLEGRYGFQAVAWQPGGELLVVSETRGENGNNLYLLDLATGRRTTLFAPRRAASHRVVGWAPDRRGFYLVTDRSGHDVLARYDLATRRLTPIVDPGFDIGATSLSFDGGTIAFTTIETGFEHLHLADAVTGSARPVPALPKGTVSPEFATGAPDLLLATNSPQTAGEIRLWTPANGTAARVIVPADSPGLDLGRMVMPVPVAFPARDGAPLTGLLYTPAPASDGRRPPVFLAVHGGPGSHAMPVFSAEKQYYLSRGVAVLDLNYRGSTGQGRAFEELNDRANKVHEVGDLADAVAWIRRQDGLDGSRVAVGGGSYGGYLTNQALGTYPDLFVAGVSAVGVSDWVTALEGASPALHASDLVEFGDIADPKVRAFFAALSPINNVAKIRTPLLVMHGANDPRDPVSESDRLVQGIRDNGGTVTYLRFPDEGHGISRLANRVHAYRQVAAFLEERFEAPASR